MSTVKLRSAFFILTPRPVPRYDHQVALVKDGGHPGQQWHTHQYASGATCGSAGNDDEGIAAVAANPVSEDIPELGFIRIFCECYYGARGASRL